MAGVNSTSRSPSSNTVRSNNQSARKSNYEPGPSLSQVAKGDGMMRGHSGQGVSDLQQKLNAAGMKPPLDVDGKLGPKTEAAIYKFQKENGLRQDGVVGKNTLQSLTAGGRYSGVEAGGAGGAKQAPTQQDLNSGPAQGQMRAGDLQNANPIRRPNSPSADGLQPGRANGPFAGDQASREAQAEQLLKANGQWPPQEGRTYAIQIDQDAPPPGASQRDRAGYLRSYSGQTAVFKAQGGRLSEVEGPMRSASHPGQLRTSQSPDVNGDGRSDIATLRSGVYEYNTRTNGRGRLNPKSNHDMQVARDLDGDGTISAREDSLAAQNRMYATGLQWHAGNSNRPSSIGCQTMAPNDFNRFTNAVQSSGDNSFTYLLVRRDNEQHGANPL
jgi:peptidoglycan hydrolase-like protein with peptidoglycan-binding domain